MTHMTEIAAGFSFVSSIVSLGLLFLALRAYSRTKDSSMLFLAAAFALFMVKAAVVGHSLLTNFISHEHLELVDAIGDMGTILLIVVPIFLPRSQE